MVVVMMMVVVVMVVVIDCAYRAGSGVVGGQVNRFAVNIKNDIGDYKT